MIEYNREIEIPHQIFFSYFFKVFYGWNMVEKVLMVSGWVDAWLSNIFFCLSKSDYSLSCVHTRWASFLCFVSSNQNLFFMIDRIRLLLLPFPIKYLKQD